jgi:hypothetical protein
VIFVTGPPRQIAYKGSCLLAAMQSYYISTNSLEQAPRTIGLPFSNWTAANLAQYLADMIDVQWSARHVENVQQAGNWRLRRPVRTVKHKQDPALVEEKRRIRQDDEPV